jgi:hypothetical protein
MRDSELIYGLKVADLVRLTGVHAATARRWRAGAGIPEPCRRLLAMSANRLAGCPGWRGWSLVGEELCSPENWTYTAGEVLALTFLRAHVATIQAELRIVRGMENQPEPAASDAYFATGRISRAGNPSGGA